MVQRRIDRNTPPSPRMSRHSAADFAYSLVSFHEQLLGSNQYIGRARTTQDIARGYQMFGQAFQSYRTAVVLPFDAGAAMTLDSLAPRRLRVGAIDLRIASIALSLGLTVLTRNLHNLPASTGFGRSWTVSGRTRQPAGDSPRRPLAAQLNGGLMSQEKRWNNGSCVWRMRSPNCNVGSRADGSGRRLVEADRQVVGRIGGHAGGLPNSDAPFGWRIVHRSKKHEP